MLDVYAFYAVAALIVGSAIFIFIERKLVHAIIALTVAFLGSAILFFLLGQMMIALLQLIVFVGGLSTYLIVAIDADEKSVRMVSAPVFIDLAAIGAFILYVFLVWCLPTTTTNSPNSFLTAATSALQSSYAMFYIIAVLLFAVSISGVLIIKKFTRMLV